MVREPGCVYGRGWVMGDAIIGGMVDQDGDAAALSRISRDLRRIQPVLPLYKSTTSLRAEAQASQELGPQPRAVSVELATDNPSPAPS